MRKKAKVAIIGTGNIGTDLLIKVIRSPYLECVAFVGRNLHSTGMQKAHSLKIPVFANGIDYFKANPNSCDIIFDATSSNAHLDHAPVFAQLNKFVIDLTPAKVGDLCVPVINMQSIFSSSNVNLITCGGQASLPIIHALSLTHKHIEYIEVVSSIASRSAGSATRINLDEYIHTTESAIKQFSGAKNVKAILNLNPAQPCINMQTTIFAKVQDPQLSELNTVLNEVVSQVQQYVPGYKIIINPMIENDRIVIMVKVKGLGDYLAEYAGNLDIINCAALAIAERYAQKKLTAKPEEKIYEICTD